MSQQDTPGRENSEEFEEKRLQSLQQILDPVLGYGGDILADQVYEFLCILASSRLAKLL